MLGLTPCSVMLLVAALNFWACVASTDVPGGQLQHKQVVEHAQQDRIGVNQTAIVAADQNAAIHALNMEIELLKSGENSTSVIKALQTEIEAQQREAAEAKIQVLDAERESQKHLAIMSQAFEAVKRNEAVMLEFRAEVEAHQAQQSAALADLQQKVASSDKKLISKQHLKPHNKKRRGLQGMNACKYDVIEDGQVDVADLLQVLADFHLESCSLRADFNGDCIVNVADLLSLLSAFGGTVSDSDCIMAHNDVSPIAYSHRWLQVTAAGRTVAENSAGPPAACAAHIVGAVYFDTDIAQFLGCTGTSWEPLGGSDGNFICKHGWGGGSCDADALAPIIECEPGTVSVQQEPNVFPHTLKAADIPQPQVRDTGPSNPGHIRVELRAPGSDGFTAWTSAEPYASLFDFGTATLSDGLSINVDIDSITTFEYIATDFEGNTASCAVDVHVVDVDECADGNPLHNCADNAVCENLYNARGEFSLGTYNCTCPHGFGGDGYTQCEPQSAPIGLRTGNLFATEYMWAGVQAIDDGAGNYVASTPAWDTPDSFEYGRTWLSHDFAVGDLNEDGNDDLFIGSRYKSSVKMAFGDGRGGWTEDRNAAVISWSYKCLACIASAYAQDLNQDGHLDIYLATGAGGCTPNGDSCTGRRNNQNQWWLGDGTGSFTEVPQNIPLLQEDVKTKSAIFADFTGDQNIDVYNCNDEHSHPARGNSFWIGDGAGTFTKGVYGPGIGGDQNENRGRADGGYGSVGGGAGRTPHMMTSTAAFGDFNKDGVLDLYLANNYQWNEFYLSDASAGTWAQTDGVGVSDTQDCAGRNACIANDVLVVDINMDGNLDLYCSNNAKNFLYLGDGNGGFTGGMSGNGYYDIFTASNAAGGNGHKKAIAADFNHDGNMDILSYMRMGPGNQLWFGDGAGGYTPQPDHVLVSDHFNKGQNAHLFN